MKPPPEYNYELKPGDDWITFNNLLVIANPDRPPIIVHVGGKQEEIKFTGDEEIFIRIERIIT